jgi:hypothetical protein
MPDTDPDDSAWRIRAIIPDFTLEDVWSLPARGDRQDFGQLIDVMRSLHPASSGSLPSRALWSIRDRLGQWFGLGRVSAPDEHSRRRGTETLTIPGTAERSLVDRLPDDLRGSAGPSSSGWWPFVALYRTDVEFAAELSNRTVHAVLHLAWPTTSGGCHGGRLGVYVKPRGRLGHAYMTVIRPFRRCIIYPELMRQIDQAWRARDLVANGSSAT